MATVPAHAAPAPVPPADAQLRIERRGGIAGLKRSVDCAVGALTAAQCAALAHVLNAPPAPPAAAPTRGVPMAADRFTYRITLTPPNGTVVSCDVPETAMPDALAGLGNLSP